MRKLTKENCLVNKFPELIKEWDYNKNGNLSPSGFSYGSHKLVWWKCKNNHEWETSIFCRARNSSNCPYCVGKKASESNCLSFKNPKLSKEWHYKKNNKLTPSDVTEFSSKKVWWKCKNNHNFKARIRDRSRGTNCPYCSGNKVSELNSISKKNPILLKEWNYKRNKINPEKFSYGSNKKVWWICRKNSKHIWMASIKSRLKRGCPYCCNKLFFKKDSFLKKKPHVANEWNYKKNKNIFPYNFTNSSNKKVWWKCKKGHEWKTTIASRSQGYGCPYCSGRKVSDKNRLSLLYPSLCREWNSIKNNNLTSDEVSIGSHKKVWWKCKKGHEWEASIKSRIAGCNCPYCNKIVLRDGISLDSILDAIKYIEYKEKGLVFTYNKKYDSRFGRKKYDFYFPNENKYVEITGYNKNVLKNYPGRYFHYLRNIVKKRHFVQNILKAKFEFIQFFPTKEQKQKVREWMK